MIPNEFLQFLEYKKKQAKKLRATKPICLSQRGFEAAQKDLEQSVQILARAGPTQRGGVGEGWEDLYIFRYMDSSERRI